MRRGRATTCAVRSDELSSVPVSLVPLAPEQTSTTCASCGAALVADQRYCLSCGQPAAPVRLAFLDVLQGQDGTQALAAPALEPNFSGYMPTGEQSGWGGWLRRNSGLLVLLVVLLLCLIVGLLVGHWVSQAGNRVPAKQVVEVKGLSGLTAAPAAAAAPSTGTAPAETKSNAKVEAEEKAEAKETKAEKAPPPPPVKVTPQKIKKLSTSTGKKHQEEINALGTQPIETG